MHQLAVRAGRDLAKEVERDRHGLIARARKRKLVGERAVLIDRAQAGENGPKRACLLGRVKRPEIAGLPRIDQQGAAARHGDVAGAAAGDDLSGGGSRSRGSERAS